MGKSPIQASSKLLNSLFFQLHIIHHIISITSKSPESSFTFKAPFWLVAWCSFWRFLCVCFHPGGNLPPGVSNGNSQLARSFLGRDGGRLRSQGMENWKMVTSPQWSFLVPFIGGRGMLHSSLACQLGRLQDSSRHTGRGSRFLKMVVSGSLYRWAW